MRFGFAKHDITPRLGVELYGYSGYLNRYATAIRDKLWARSVAVGNEKETVVVVSCDLVWITNELAEDVRSIVREETGIDGNRVMIHATHTHSGPCLRISTRHAYDPPYMELLPRRIASACINAVKNLREAELFHALVPCEGMGVNRVYDKFNYGKDVFKDGFRPAKPELTDTSCHVFKAVADGKITGFISYFGCHNVVGGPECTYVHGDYAGIATSMLEKEHPGATGVFLQGAEGDVNTAACCFGNGEVLEALDIMAGRYARAVRNGLNEAKPLQARGIGFVQIQKSFSRMDVPADELQGRLDAENAIIRNPDADDSDLKFRMAVLRKLALQSIIKRLENGESFENQTELQGIRFGPVALLAAPFEIFQGIKNDVAAKAKAPIPLVMSVTNDQQGYAVDKQAAQNENDYAARTVPLWKHTLPYANIHQELAESLLNIDAELENQIKGK